MPEILISSSVLILVLAILRLVLREKISARLQYALWLLVLVRLLVPVSFFHSPVSVAGAAAPVTERVESVTGAILRTGPIYPGEQTLSEIVSADIPDQAVVPVWTLVHSARAIWYAGMLAMAVWFLFVNARLARRLKKTRTPYDFHSVVPVYVAEGIPSPCLFGLCRPAVYLTERAAEDDAQARQIIAHELTHRRHGDMLWALLRSVCLVVWWFNPLVWLAAALSRQDCELACDEGTIRALGEDARFDYGRTLVGMARVGAKPSDLLCGATTMTTGKRSLKERVARIAKAPKASVIAVILALCVAVIAVGCTFTGAEKEDGAAAGEVALESAVDDAASPADVASEGVPGVPIPTAEGLVSAMIAIEGKHVELTEPEDLEQLLTRMRSVEFRLADDPGLFEVPGAQSGCVTLRYDDGTEAQWTYPVMLADGVCYESDLGSPGLFTVFFPGYYEPAGMDTIDQALAVWLWEYVRLMETAPSFEQWAPFIYFENDYSRQLAEDNWQPIEYVELLAAEQVNEDLVAFLIRYGVDSTPALQFVGRVDGWPYIFRNKAAVPEELRAGLEALTLPDPTEEDESFMAVDTFYWDEVERELGGFARSGDIEVHFNDAPAFDETLPADDIFGPMTLEDYIYGTDSWEFRYGGEEMANAPAAVIIVRDEAGRALWIMDDADALMIDEGDGTITWVTYAGHPVDCADMIRHLLPWARGEFSPGISAAAGGSTAE